MNVEKKWVDPRALEHKQNVETMKTTFCTLGGLAIGLLLQNCSQTSFETVGAQTESRVEEAKPSTPNSTGAGFPDLSL